MIGGDLARRYIPEGQTWIFEGPQRHGKTLAMVFRAWYMRKTQGRKIHSNIALSFPYAPLEFADLRLADGMSKFWGGHICIDELNFYFDGRSSMTPENKKFSAFLLQQKKQGCNVTGTTHELDSLDKRIRFNYDYIVRPSVYPSYPDKPERLTMRIENGPLQAAFRRKVTIDCTAFLRMYDTFAVHDPFKKEVKAK